MGNKVRYSITRALAQVKLIESKLGNPKVGFDIKLNGNDKLKNHPQYTLVDFKSEVQKEQDSFNSLFDNRLRIKSAIAKANIETKIKVGGKEYSIIELIDLKTSSSYKLKYYNGLIIEYNQCVKTLDIIQNKIDTEVSNQVASANQNKNQVSKDLATSLTETYTKLWGGEIIGLDINKIQEEKAKLEDLLKDIDMTLSEINAKTEIEVELD